MLKLEKSQADWVLVAPATWETEIGRSTVLGKPGQNKFVKPHLKGKKAECGDLGGIK
jgi:hypothetical protein